MDSLSGVGVLDKAVAILDALEPGPLSLALLVDATGLSRATAHRLARALEAHRFVERDSDGRFRLGERLVAHALPVVARPAMERLRHATGESVQLYVRRGEQRLCVSALESPHGLRTIVPVGSLLPLDRGSAGRVLRGLSTGWAESVEERQRGVASVSAPVYDGDRLVAAVSVSGPVDRTTREPGRRYGADVLAAAEEITQALSARPSTDEAEPGRRREPGGSADGDDFDAQRSARRLVGDRVAGVLAEERLAQR